MALSALIVAWLDHLANRSVLPGGAYLELGPQAVSAPRRLVGDFLRRRTGSDQVGDACFVALRRTAESPAEMIMPPQGVYASSASWRFAPGASAGSADESARDAFASPRG